LIAGLLTNVGGIGGLSPLKPVGAETSPTTWSAVNTSGGGWVTGMVTGPTGEVYSRTDVGGTYRWDESTEAWSQMLVTPGVPNPMGGDYNVESLAVAGSDGNILYIAAGGNLHAAEGRILRSADGGRTWRDGGARFKIDGNANWRWAGERLSVDPADANVVMFGSRTQGLWRSEDGAQTWKQTAAPGGVAGSGEPAGVMFTLFDPKSPVVAGRTQGAWAGVQNVGILRTDDGGSTWRVLHSVTNGVPRDAEVAADGTLYVVINGGSSTVLRVDRSSRVTNVSPQPGGDFAMVAVDPLNPSRVFVGDDGVRDGKLWRSLDGGASWAALDIALAASPNDSWATSVDIEGWMSGGALAFDPARPGRLWFAEGMGMWRSTDLSDSEVTWTFASRGIEELVSNAAVKPPGQPLITASWDRGLFRHPTPETGGAYPPYRKEFGSAWDVTSSPDDPNFLAAVLDDHQDPWSSTHADRRASGFSLDGGASWSRFGALAGGTAPADLKFGNIAVSARDSANLVWVPSNVGAKAYYTTDRGASWRASVLNGVVAGDYLHPAHYLKRRILTADPHQPGTFYALGGNDITGDSALWKTVDRGASWVKTTTTGLRRAYWDFRFNAHLVAIPGKPGLLFAIAGPTDSGGHPYWRSTDGGVTWTEQSQVLDAHVLAVGAPMQSGGNPTLFTYGRVGGQIGVYRSSDLGESWSFLVDYPRGWYQRVTAMAGDPEVPGKVYVGFTGGGFVMGQLTTSTAAPTTTMPAPTTTTRPTPTTAPPTTTAPAPTTTTMPTTTTTAPPTTTPRCLTTGKRANRCSGGSVRALSTGSPVAEVGLGGDRAVGMAVTSSGNGYWIAGATGTLVPRGDATDHGEVGDLSRPVVGVAANPSASGYWLVTSDGAVLPFGGSTFHGSTAELALNRPMIAMAPTPSGRGYWLLASDGGIFSFGDAAFHGSTGDLVLNRPVVGMTSTPSGQGYWLVASDGGIFSFGDAAFYGSTGDIVLNQPIAGMTRSPSGNGYRMVASDGGIFSFGDAFFYGSTGGLALEQPVVAMAPTPTGAGYWMLASDGGIFSFGDAG